jgi:hypothetical protein
MKKYAFVFALFAVTALTACGTGSTTNEKTDSTSVNSDSVAVSATDSTGVVSSTDSSKVEAVK